MKFEVIRAVRRNPKKKAVVKKKPKTHKQIGSIVAYGNEYMLVVDGVRYQILDTILDIKDKDILLYPSLENNYHKDKTTPHTMTMRQVLDLTIDQYKILRKNWSLYNDTLSVYFARLDSINKYATGLSYE